MESRKRLLRGAWGRLAVLGLCLAAFGCGPEPLTPDTIIEDPGKGDCTHGGPPRLSVVGTPSRTLFPSDTVTLEVAFKDSCNLGHGNMSVNFELINDGTGSQLSAASAITDPRGIAAVMVTASQRPGFFQVWAYHDMHPAGVTFDIRIEEERLECDNDDECPDGYHCEAPLCQPGDPMPGTCETTADCPQNYFCEGHECYLCDPDSLHPECTSDRPDPCAGVNCPGGYVCKDGVCVDDPAVNDEDLPDVSGTWYTEYHFDVSDSLAGINSMSGLLDTLNELVNYCEFTGIDPVDAFLCDQIEEFVPDWAGDLINIFANLAHILSEMRAEGTMVVSQHSPRDQLVITEIWNHVLISFPDACCAGRPDSCNPYNQPDYPRCAQVDMTREELAWGDVGLEVQGFEGRIETDDSGAIPVYTFAYDDRKVRIEYSKFVAYVVELLVRIVTPHDSLDEALEEIIDCQAVQGLVNDIMGSYAIDIVQECEELKPQASELLLGLLNQIGTDWKLMKFDGRASITHNFGHPPYALALGVESHETDGDGSCDGDFKVLLSGDMDGSFHGQR